MLTFNEADRLFRYDPHTGMVFWRVVTRNRSKGAVGMLTDKGYLIVRIRGRDHRVHRVVWLLTHGEYPSGQIDHINGIRTDNRIINLRCVSNLENHRNMKMFTTCSSGVVGVSWNAERQKWYASICVQGKTLSLGRHDAFDAAVVARKSAEQNHQFHKNHGRITK